MFLCSADCVIPFNFVFLKMFEANTGYIIFIFQLARNSGELRPTKLQNTNSKLNYLVSTFKIHKHVRMECYF